MGMMRAGAHLGTTGIWRKASRFWSDRRGIAAVEFALIMPILLIMYLVTMEASQAIETSKKVSRIGSMVADLVTQQPTADQTTLKAIMEIGSVTLQPYTRSKPKITITAIQVPTDITRPLQVKWSRQLIDGRDGAGPTTTTVPPKLLVADTFLIRVDSILTYKTVLGLGLGSTFNNLSMSETYYLRPRRSATIPCTNC
ncbi:TadE/TadG family type IV pilus assembly protein [Mesorhizobium sp. M0496]|uniref:TadE/TadG family type IV pilus assembly protein n=1 Tax=Mesorhizobium sp. M0496 TaxID=2956952 RepID=UPI00333BFA26